MYNRHMVETLTRFEALMRCYEVARTESKMARDLGVSQPTIWRWLNQSKQMPPEHVLDAERLYGVSRHALRPDIYPRNHPPAPDDNRRWIGIDMAAPGHDPSAYVTVPAAIGAR